MNNDTEQNLKELEEAAFEVKDFPLGFERDYIQALVENFPGTILFKTGAGHIYYDLIKNLPVIPDYEDQKAALCRQITDAVYPLTASLMARAVSFILTVEATPLHPPLSIDAFATYLAYDIDRGVLRRCFLSQHHELPDSASLSIPKGLTVLSQPLDYQYHELTDDRAVLPAGGVNVLPNKDWPDRYADLQNAEVDKSRDIYKTPQAAIKGIGTPTVMVGTRLLGNVGEAVITGVISDVLPKATENFFDLQPAAQKYWRHKLELEKAQKLKAQAKPQNLSKLTPEPLPVQTPLPEPEPTLPQNTLERKLHHPHPMPGLDPEPFSET